MAIFGCGGADENDPEKTTTTDDTDDTIQPTSGHNDTQTTELCDIQAVFARSCAGCHGGENPQSGLDLAKPNLASRLVDVTSENCEDEVLADPAHPTASYLYQKILPDSVPPCGEPMPPAGITPLTTEEIECVREWISGLLPSDSGTSCEPREVEVCEDLGNADWWPQPGEEGNVNHACEQPTQMCAADGSSWLPCEGVYPGIERCDTAFDENCDGKTPECSATNWAFSIVGDDSKRVNSVGVDGNGNVFITGEFEGYTDFGGGKVGSDLPGGQFKNDVFLAKYNKYGTPVWSQTFGDSSNQYAPQLGVDRKTGAVAVAIRLFGGITFESTSYTQKGSSDFIVAAFSNDGAHRWSQQFGSGGKDRAERIVFSRADGDVIVGGKIGYSTEVPAMIPGAGPVTPQGEADGIVVKLNGATGSVRWHQLLGGEKLVVGDRPIAGVGTVCDPGDGSVYRRCKGCGAQHCESNGTWGATCEPLEVSGAFRFPCERADLICSQQAGREALCESGDDDYVFGVDTDKSGDVYVTGRWEGKFSFTGLDGQSALTEVESHGQHDIFVVKLDGVTGIPIWSRHIGGAEDDRAYDLALQPQSGNVVIAGYFSGEVDFGGVSLSAKGGALDDDVFVMQLNPATGATEFAKGYGDEGSQFGYRHELGKTTRSLNLVTDAQDAIYIGGTLYGSWDGKITSPANSSGDLRPNPFYVKLDPNGSYLYGATYGGSGSEFAYDLALDPTSASLVMVGNFFGRTLALDGATVKGISEVVDGFVSKFTPR